MPRTARKLSSTNMYHVMLRGINHQQIFEETIDYQKFLYVVSDCNKISHFKLHAFCLMDNHIHLLIEVCDEPLSQIIRRIGSRFVYWYNTKYQRCGHLFQDRFRSEIINDNAHFLRVLRYILQNPVKAGLAPYPAKYPWSSYSAYIGNEDSLTYTQKALSLFQNPDDFFSFINQPSTNHYLDIPTSKRIPDSEAHKIIREISHCQHISEFQKLDRKQQSHFVSQMRKHGLSIRQISRLCGISKSFVERA